MGAILGLNSLYYAIMNSDTPGGSTTYGTPVSIADFMKVKTDMKQSLLAIYSDDGLSEEAIANGEGDIGLDLKYLSLEVRAALLGHTVTSGIMISNKFDIPPYVAIGYKRRKTDGKYVYKWLYKCIFIEPVDDGETLSDKPKPSFPTLDGKIMPRLSDGASKRDADEGSLTYVSSIGTSWFTNVNVTSDLVAPTVSTITPAAGATAISKSTTVVWVMSKALDPSTAIGNNFYLVNDATGALVPASVAYNSSTFTITLTPTSALAGTTKFMAVADQDVRDLSGNALVYTASYFTTTT